MDIDADDVAQIREGSSYALDMHYFCIFALDLFVFRASMYIAMIRGASASKGKYSYQSLLRQMKDLYKAGELPPHVARVSLSMSYIFQLVLSVRSQCKMFLCNLRHIVGQRQI